MTTTLATVTTTTVPSARTVLSRIVVAVTEAMARAKARSEYRRLLECDDIMRDVGVDRDEIRRALMAINHRM
jgi:uncharacterized protein YjiS (DUF1127 family)